MGVSPAAIKADTLGNPHYLGIKDRVSTGLTNAELVLKYIWLNMPIRF
jgi:hypothetical protein